MSNSIGNLSLQISGNAQGLRTALAQAQQMVTGFAAKINGVARSLPFVGNALSGVFGGGITQAMKEQLDEVAALNREARQFGVSIESLSGMMYAAGGSQDAFRTGLGHLARELGLVRQGSEEASSKFERLGLHAGQLANLSLDDAFRKVAETIRQLPTAADQAAAAFQIFGKGGLELIPMLQRGAAGIAELQNRARELGLTIAPEAADKMERGKKAIRTIEQSFTGLARTITVEAAPTIEAFSATVQGVIGFLTQKNRVVDGLRAVVSQYSGILITAVGAVAVYKTATIALTTAKQALAKTEAFLMALSGPKGWLNLAVALGAATVATLAMDAAFKDVTKSVEGANAARDKSALQVADAERFAAMAASAKKYEDVLKSIHEEIRSLKGLGRDFEGDALLAGVKGEQLEKIREAMRELDKERRFKRMQDDAKAFIDQSVSGFNKFEHQIIKLNDLARGVLPNSAYRRGVGQLGLDLLKNSPGNRPTQFAPAALAGSAEAIKILDEAQFGQKGNIQEEIKRAIEDLKAEDALQSDILRQIYDALSKDQIAIVQKRTG